MYSYRHHRQHANSSLCERKQLAHSFLLVSFLALPIHSGVNFFTSFLDKARDCLKISVRSTSACDASSKQYILKQANEFLGESMELTCGNNYNYKDDKCVGVMTSLPDLPKTIKRPQTVIPVTIGVMSKFLS